MTEQQATYEVQKRPDVEIVKYSSNGLLLIDGAPDDVQMQGIVDAILGIEGAIS